LLVKETKIPPVGAGAVSVTVPVDGDPPITVVGFRLRLDKVKPLIVNVALTEFAPTPAVIVALIGHATCVVEIVKVAVVAPAFTDTVAGTVAADWLLPRLTAIPPAGATPFRVTVPVDDAPPIKAEGFRLRPTGDGELTVNATPVDTEPRMAVIVAIEVTLTG